MVGDWSETRGYFTDHKIRFAERTKLKRQVWRLGSPVNDFKQQISFEGKDFKLPRRAPYTLALAPASPTGCLLLRSRPLWKVGGLVVSRARLACMM